MMVISASLHRFASLSSSIICMMINNHDEGDMLYTYASAVNAATNLRSLFPSPSTVRFESQEPSEL